MMERVTTLAKRNQILRAVVGLVLVDMVNQEIRARDWKAKTHIAPIPFVSPTDNADTPIAFEDERFHTPKPVSVAFSIPIVRIAFAAHPHRMIRIGTAS